MKKTLFLGGNTNSKFRPNWRNQLLENKGLVSKFDMFNPVVKNWSESDQLNEEIHRNQDDVLLFALMGNNIFSIAEAVDCSNKRPESTIVLIDLEEIERNKSIRIKSIKEIGRMLSINGTTVVYTMDDLIHALKRV